MTESGSPSPPPGQTWASLLPPPSSLAGPPTRSAGSRQVRTAAGSTGSLSLYSPASRLRQPVLSSSGCQDNRRDMQIETPCVVTMGTCSAARHRDLWGSGSGSVSGLTHRSEAAWKCQSFRVSRPKQSRFRLHAGGPTLHSHGLTRTSGQWVTEDQLVLRPPHLLPRQRKQRLTAAVDAPGNPPRQNQAQVPRQNQVQVPGPGPGPRSRGRTRPSFRSRVHVQSF